MRRYLSFTDWPARGCLSYRRSRTPVFRQVPPRYRELFIEGCTEVIVKPEPVRFNGAAARQDGEIELYQAAFMPLLGPNSSRPLIFGSFNYRSVIQESRLAWKIHQAA